VKIVDRYTLREFAGPFVAAVAGFAIMLVGSLLFELTDLIVQKKMPASTVARMLVYKLPSVIVVSLPIAALFAALISLGRLAKDSEMKVFLCTGTSFKRLVAPVFVAALLVSGLSFVLNEKIVPASNHVAENLYRQAVLRDPLPSVEQGVFFRGGEERYFYVGRVDRKNKEMHRILIFDRSAGAYPTMISAASGVYQERTWLLKDGVIKRLDDDGFTVEDFGFETMEYPVVENFEVYTGNQKTTDEMTRAELADYIRLFKRSGLDVKRLEVAYHMKASLPMAGFLWVLVGAPLTLRSMRGGRVFGVVASLAVAFLYHVTASFFQSIGGTGLLPPLVAAWATNILFFTVGIVLLIRSDR